jgi:hypothetical protein
MLIKKIVVACFVFGLVACAGRQANTVASIQPGDDIMTCDQIVATIKLNTISVKDLMGESSSTVGKNVVAGVAGVIVFFPALFFMDAKNAAGDEARALVRRNEVLFKRHQLLKCEPAIEAKNTSEMFIFWDQQKPDAK